MLCYNIAQNGQYRPILLHPNINSTVLLGGLQQLPLSGIPQVLLDLMRLLLGRVLLKGLVLEGVVLTVLLKGVVLVVLLEAVVLLVLLKGVVLGGVFPPLLGELGVGSQGLAWVLATVLPPGAPFSSSVFLPCSRVSVMFRLRNSLLVLPSLNLLQQFLGLVQLVGVVL